MKVDDKNLTALKETLEYWGNNCGGCETCGQVFGNKTQPEFDLQELHMIVSELIELRARIRAISLPVSFCSDCSCGKAEGCK